MASPRAVLGVLFLIALAVSPVVAALQGVILATELRPDAPRSLRQSFWLRKDELTPWGQRARTVFRLYWLGLLLLFVAAAGGSLRD